MRALDVQVSNGCADDPEEGVTIAVHLSNGDFVQIEVVPEKDSIWVQYNQIKDGAFEPGDGYLSNLAGLPQMT